MQKYGKIFNFKFADKFLYIIRLIIVFKGGAVD
jgi:hypothetical protein